MQVICLEDAAFHALIDEVVLRLKQDQQNKFDKWINEDQAMNLLNVRSKTTLQNYRNEGKIRFTQPSRKHILYDRDSIMEYLETHARETF